MRVLELTAVGATERDESLQAVADLREYILDVFLGEGSLLVLRFKRIEFLPRFLVCHLSLQVGAEGLHHGFKREWQVMAVCVCRRVVVAARMHFISALAREKLLSLLLDDTLEAVQVVLTVDDGLEFLERELVAVEHVPDGFTIEHDVVLLE